MFALANRATKDAGYGLGLPLDFLLMVQNMRFSDEGSQFSFLSGNCSDAGPLAGNFTRISAPWSTALEDLGGGWGSLSLDILTPAARPLGAGNQKSVMHCTASRTAMSQAKASTLT